MKKISVIVPIYNVAQYLESCLESIRNQDFEDYEVILVEDGSTDESKKIAEEFVAKQDDKFRLIYQENKGLSGARNTGLQYTEAEYICFVDSDDTIEKNYLSSLYRAAQEKDADLVFCAFRSVDEQGGWIRDYCEKNITPNKVYNLRENKELFLIQNAAWNKLYKKDLIFENHLLFTEGVWYEDLRFTKKYLMVAEKCVYCDEVLYNYRQRSGSIMNSMKSERNLEILDALDEVEAFFEQCGQLENYREEIEILAIDHIYISALVRLIRTNEKAQVKKIREEMEKRYPNYRKNKYVKTLEKNRQIVFHLLNLKCDWAVKLIFMVKG